MSQFNSNKHRKFQVLPSQEIRTRIECRHDVKQNKMSGDSSSFLDRTMSTRPQEASKIDHVLWRGQRGFDWVLTRSARRLREKKTRR